MRGPEGIVDCHRGGIVVGAGIIRIEGSLGGAIGNGRGQIRGATARYRIQTGHVHGHCNGLLPSHTIRIPAEQCLAVRSDIHGYGIRNTIAIIERDVPYGTAGMCERYGGTGVGLRPAIDDIPNSHGTDGTVTIIQRGAGKRDAGGGRDPARYRRRRVQVGGHIHPGGGHRSDVGTIQLQITSGAGDGAVAVGAEYGQALALAVHHIAVAVHAHGTGTRIGVYPIVVHDQETLTTDGKVQVVIGETDVPLGELLGDRGDPHTAADGIGGHPQVGAGEDVGEFRARLLEAGGTGIGDVVADDTQFGGRGIQTTQCGTKGHGVTPSSGNSIRESGGLP